MSAKKMLLVKVDLRLIKLRMSVLWLIASWF